MIVGGIVLNRAWWSTNSSGAPSAVALNVSMSIPDGVPPPSSGLTAIIPSTEMADRSGRDRSAAVGLSLWALAIGTVSLPLATVFRVMAWGSGTAGSQVGSVTPQGEPGSLGYDESGYYIGAGHPDYGSQNW